MAVIKQGPSQQLLQGQTLELLQAEVRGVQGQGPAQVCPVIMKVNQMQFSILLNGTYVTPNYPFPWVLSWATRKISSAE